jgi:hypothetical protein
MVNEDPGPVDRGSGVGDRLDQFAAWRFRLAGLFSAPPPTLPHVLVMLGTMMSRMM